MPAGSGCLRPCGWESPSEEASGTGGIDFRAKPAELIRKHVLLRAALTVSERPRRRSLGTLRSMNDGHEGLVPIDVSEHGAQRDGKPQVLDRRLFMQLIVLTCQGAVGPERVIETLG